MALRHVVWSAVVVPILLLALSACVKVITSPEPPDHRVQTDQQGPVSASGGDDVVAELVPLDPSHEVRFQILHPRGADVHVSGLKDLVEIIEPPLRIHVHTTQLRGEVPPASEQEMRKRVAEWAPNATVRSRSMAGTVAAFELQYTTEIDGNPRQNIDLALYGSTYQQWVSLDVPRDAYSTWESALRQIVDSFTPSNLDATPLDSRP